MTTPSRRDLANAIRFLAIDAVQAANSGHPGMPMGMADIAEVLWNDYLGHNPNNPKWFNRDRFVLSNGHGSMLQYALLHLSGYDLPIEQIKRFRQLESQTPGHPENFMTPGVETTTGPLGQGFANAVGMALAEKVLAQRFNRPEFAVVDHRTWVFMGDGCMMEGISHEAASLAGTLGLGKLVAFWDDNHISIDGEVEGWFTDDTPARFESYGWRVIRDVDGHDAGAIKAAIEQALAHDDKPVLVCCRTTIGFGSPNKAGKEASHGAALGKDEVEATRKALGWEHGPFEIPQEIRDGWRAGNAGLVREEQWNRMFDQYAARHPELAEELVRRSHAELPEGFAAAADAYVARQQAEGKVVASRKASQMAIEAFAPHLPELIGGSADLASSNLTLWSGSKSVATDSTSIESRAANYIYFGVREFAMTAISNGLAVHGGFIPYDATFLVFSDYARNAVRMSALMGAHAIHVYTHDSIGLGEDGPTHQPVEQLAAMRAMPGIRVIRPADANETAWAWRTVLENTERPAGLILTRQNVPTFPRGEDGFATTDDVARGAYVLADTDGTPDAIIVATGSEVGLAMTAREQLAEAGVAVRVVSAPCLEWFEEQDRAYRESVLPRSITARVSVEAGTGTGWHKYVGTDGEIVSVEEFGASGAGDLVLAERGITIDAVVAAVHRSIANTAPDQTSPLPGGNS